MIEFDKKRINNIISHSGKDDNISHAFIVEGESGKTRDEFIDLMVAILQCEASSSEVKPCGSCNSCRLVTAGTSLDVYHMGMSGKNSYKTEDAIAMMDKLRMGAYGKHVIGIIDDADILSEIIQNKLLKTLEEPEPGAVIIMGSSNKDRLLKTVRSRCQAIRVSDYTEQGEEDLSGREFLEELAEKIASEKSFFYEIRDAISKNIKTRKDAEELIGILEDKYRYNMINTEAIEEMADAIDVAEGHKKRNGLQ